MQDLAVETQQNTLSRNVWSERTFLLFGGLTIFLLLVRDLGYFDVSKWIFVIIAVVVFALYDLNHMAIFTCFLIPLKVGIPGSYIFAAGLVILIIKNLDWLLLSQYIWILVAIFMVELLSFIYGDFSIVDYIRFAAPLLVIALLIFNGKDKFDYQRMLMYFLLGVAFAEASVIWQSISVSGLENLISSGVRLGETSELLIEEGMRITFNPNGFAILCAMSISMLLVFLSRPTNYKPVWASLLVFQIFVGSLSISRSFLVLLVAITLMFLLSRVKSARDFMKSLGMIVLVLIAAYFLIDHFSPSLFPSYVARFSEADLSNKRLDITTSYFIAMEQEPDRLLLGVGLQNYPAKYGQEITSHNGIQEVLITWGIVGLILVTIFICGIFAEGWRGVSRHHSQYLYMLPLLVLLISIQPGQFFSSNIPFYLLPVFATLRLAERENPMVT
ncbi:MAG: O-antigen ligase family protein [Syntrophomonadaceae bacterium]